MSLVNPLSLGIIGCGWVGLPLAELFVKNGVHVVATTQTSERLIEITATGADAEILALPFSFEQNEQQKVFSQQSLLIAIPPQIKHGKTDYAKKVAQVVVQAEKSGVKRIVLISTTAVYNGLSGNVDEERGLDFDADKVGILAAAEQAVLNFKGEGVVLRLAGLIGPKRHPARFINSQRLLSNGHAPINLIHLTDVLGLLTVLLKIGSPVGIFNGVNDTHISKKDFYTLAAKSVGIEPAKFAEGTSDVTRIISGDKTKQELAYQYVHDDLVTWVNSSSY